MGFQKRKTVANKEYSPLAKNNGPYSRTMSLIFKKNGKKMGQLEEVNK